MSMAQVRAESAIKEAEGKMEAAKRDADAHLYQKQKQAEGMYCVDVPPSSLVHRT